MNEEELINKIWKANSNKIRLLLTNNSIQKEEYLSDLIRYGINEGFQKGKLEQKKEEFAFLNGVLKLPEVWALVVAKRLKQLQKEIGEEKGK